MSYATLADFKSYITEMTGGVQTTFTTAENTLLQSFLDQADAEIYSQTGRTFGQGDSGHTHYYTMDDVDGDTLWLADDLVSVTSITNGDGTSVTAGQYWLLPMNVAVTEQNAYRGSYYAIKLKSGYAWTVPTDARITVVGRFGFMQGAPSDVIRASMRLAYWFWAKRNETGATDVAGEGLTQQSDSYPADVRAVMSRYKRRSYR